MANPKEPTSPPAPAIGKIGPYTVFLTPPATPKPQPQPQPQSQPQPLSSDIPQTPKKLAVHIPPPVQPPPVQFDQPSDYRFGFLRDALTKVQNVHVSVDEFMANWLGLNQSKFQWALNDYYEAQGVEKGDVTKEVSSKTQTV